MDKIIQQAERFKTLDIWGILLKLLMENKELIEEMNRIQLFKGITSEGEKITPSYSDDSFFKSEKHAQGYAKWKEKLNRNPYFTEKGYDTPDFFIKGTIVHDMITASLSGKKITIEAKGKGASFDSKWKNIYGLTRENLDKLIEIVYPPMMVEIRKHLGL